MGHVECPPGVKSPDPLGREPSDEMGQNRPSGVTLPHNNKKHPTTGPTRVGFNSWVASIPPPSRWCAGSTKTASPASSRWQHMHPSLPASPPFESNSLAAPLPLMAAPLPSLEKTPAWLLAAPQAAGSNASQSL
jgi:hypothetical protein